MAASDLPTLAVFKFASCDGCQLSLLDCEDELLSVAARLDIVNFPEASRRMLPGPYDIALVEGSVTTEHDRQRIQHIREQSRFLICIGACATAGGLQAMRNFSDVDAYAASVYPHPEYLSTLAQSVPIAQCVRVDYELQGCPVDKHQLLEVVLAFAAGRSPQIARESVCMECKARGNVCVLVTAGEHCLGPVTQAGCGALCPSYDRGCYGCFGAKEAAQVEPLIDYLRATRGMTDTQAQHSLCSYNAAAQPLQIAAAQYRAVAVTENRSEACDDDA